MWGVFIFDYEYGIVGSDLRQQLLLRELGRDKFCIYYDINLKEEENSLAVHKEDPKKLKIKKAISLKEVVEKSQNLLLPIPMCKEGKINKSEGEETGITEFLTYLKRGQNLFAGKIPKEVQKAALEKGVGCYDYMAEERIAVYNSIATAEGTIAELLKTSPYNLHGSSILILGYGRCGKLLAKKLQALDAKVTVCARRQEVLMEAYAFGYHTLSLHELAFRIKEFPMIINTIPERIIRGEILEAMDQTSVFYEIASEPYGIDQKEAKEKKIRVEILGGLPGKYSPVSSALILKEYILEKGENRSKKRRIGEDDKK